ncbi:hypothetical protein [Clostridium beijerinckii]|uniref:hypothetical protein n=1 Tax=Clostridium beijerinckii TaxID=1520 RepID=UPI001F187EE9|nr:hypothetical protein [Clostridium beijerinckii]
MNEKEIERKIKLAMERKNIKYFSFLFASIHFTLTLFWSTNIFNVTQDKIIFNNICRLLEFIAMYIFWYQSIMVVSDAIKKDKTSISFLRYFCVYFIIMMFFLILTWPGIFKGDEFYVIPKSVNLQIQYNQHYLTSIYYIISMMIIPTVSGITIVQLLIISFIVANILKNVESRLKRKRLTWLMMVPFLFLPAIDNNLFTLRSSMICYLYLAMIFHIINAYEYEKITKKHILLIMILTSVIAAWKTEFIYLPIVNTIALAKLFKFKLKNAAILFVFMLVAICGINFFQNDSNNNTYILTSVINPLSIIVSDPNMKSPNLEQDKDNIENVVLISDLQRYASFENIPVYHMGLVKHYITREEKNKFLYSYVRLVLYNFDTFIKARMKTFFYTSGFKKDYINHTGYENPDIVLKLEYYGSNFFMDHFKYVKPLLGQNLREETIKILACRNLDDYHKTNFLYGISYNVVPSILILIGVFITSFIKRIRLFCWISIICFIQFPIIFFTAPATFWMYYMCLYLCGYIILTYILICYLDNK